MLTGAFTITVTLTLSTNQWTLSTPSNFCLSTRPARQKTALGRVERRKGGGNGGLARVVAQHCGVDAVSEDGFHRVGCRLDGNVDAQPIGL